MISIAYNGQELGQFTADEVAAMFESGKIDKSAHYWMEGMLDWMPITEIIKVGTEEPDVSSKDETSASISRKKKGDPNASNKTHLNFLTRRNISTDGITKEAAAALVEQVKREEERQRIAINPRQKAFLDYHHIPYTSETSKDDAWKLINEANFPNSRWLDERHVLHPDLYAPPIVIPMTNDQRAFLDYHGILYTEHTTNDDARKLIRHANFPDSQWEIYKHLIRPDIFEKPNIGLSTKDELKQAKERLASAQEKYKKVKSTDDADADDIELAKQEIEDIREEIEDLKAQIEDDKLAMQDGTDEVSTFIEAWVDGYYLHSGQNLESFKKVVKKPTKTQYKALNEMLAVDLGICISVLSLDQFLCLYLQQFPEVLKEPYQSKDFPDFSLKIPETYDQQRQSESATTSANKSSSTAKKGCLGVVMMTVTPLAALFVWAVFVLRI
jgi:hypothetical protein